MKKNQLQGFRGVYDDRQEDATAIKRCLDYLCEEAERSGMKLAAHLIGVASQAVSESIDAEQDSGSVREAENATSRSGQLLH